MQVPHTMLEPNTLRAVIEELVTRDGTDYGSHEAALETKIRQVMEQLRRGDAVLVFDEDSETCNIVRAPGR